MGVGVGVGVELELEVAEAEGLPVGAAESVVGAAQAVTAVAVTTERSQRRARRGAGTCAGYVVGDARCGSRGHGGVAWVSGWRDHPKSLGECG